MLIFPTMRLAFNCPCALQPFSRGAILFFGTTEGRRKKEEGRKEGRKKEEGRRKKEEGAIKARVSAMPERSNRRVRLLYKTYAPHPLKPG